MIDENHISRLMKVCKALGTGNGLTLMQIRTKFKCSRRTAYRDMTILGDMGIPVARSKQNYTIKVKPADCRKRIYDTCVKKLNTLLDRSMR